MNASAHPASRVGVFALLAGCLCCEEPSAEFAPVVWDSLGIEIVEYPAQAAESKPEWLLSDEPILEIGAAEGEEEYELYDVVAAHVVDPTRIAVALRFANQIRFFDIGGTYLESVGRTGGGPGEFETIMGLWPMGADSIGVFDFGNARLTVLTSLGQLGRAYRFQQVPGLPLPLPVGPFSDGTFLGRAHMLGTEIDRPEGIHRGVVQFVRWSATGELLDSLTDRPDGERYHGRVEGRPIMGSPPFSRQFAVATGAHHWYYSAMSANEIEVYSTQGQLVRLVRRGGSLRPVSRAMKDEWLDSARERWSRMPAPVLAWRLSLPFPETLPAHGDMVVDDLGKLWVAEYALPSEPQKWVVYGPTGLLIGRAQTPPDGAVTHIGEDFILGVWRDELDVELVRMYRLSRSD